MAAGHDSRRVTFELTPPGPEVAAGAARLTAGSGGELAGALVDGAVPTWLRSNGGRVLLIWPRRFRARWDPLEVLDDTGRVVARGGESVRVQGGYLKPGDARVSGGEPAFAAAAVVDPPRS